VVHVVERRRKKRKRRREEVGVGIASIEMQVELASKRNKPLTADQMETKQTKIVYPVIFM
jgi:hypothetical protein